MRHNFTLTTLLLWIVMACSASDETEPVDPPDELGSFGVGHVTFTAVDSSRNDRSLKLDAWYPVDEADGKDSPRTSYPLMGVFALESDVALEQPPVSARVGQTLLVFSHGYRSINIQSTALMEQLASHGFIVISPEHTGNAQSSPTDDYDTAAANRVPDITFVIDTMLKKNATPDDPFYNRLNTERFGVLGHSFGGMTSIGMAAGWAGAMPDQRVTAIAPISAVIDKDLGTEDRPSEHASFSTQQLGSVTVPVMLIGGTEDVNVPIENNELAFAGITGSPRVYKVDIIGANHTHFANICAIGDLLIESNLGRDTWAAIGAEDLIEPYDATCTPDVFSIEEAHRLQNLYVTAFFKRHLLEEAGYDRYLSEEHAAVEPAIAFTAK